MSDSWGTWKGWTTPLPIYVTRKETEGCGVWSGSALVVIPAVLLVWLNVIAWSLIGLYEASRVVL